LPNAVRFAQTLLDEIDNPYRLSHASGYLLNTTLMVVSLPDTLELPAFACCDIPTLLKTLNRYVGEAASYLPVILAANIDLMRKFAVHQAHGPPELITNPTCPL